MSVMNRMWLMDPIRRDILAEASQSDRLPFSGLQCRLQRDGDGELSGRFGYDLTRAPASTICRQVSIFHPVYPS